MSKKRNLITFLEQTTVNRYNTSYSQLKNRQTEIYFNSSLLLCGQCIHSFYFWVKVYPGLHSFISLLLHNGDERRRKGQPD